MTTPTDRLHALDIEVPEVKKADADYRAWYLGDASSTDAMVSQSYAIDALVDVAETLKDEVKRLKARRCETCGLQHACYIGRMVKEQDAAQLGVSCLCWQPREEAHCD